MGAWVLSSHSYDYGGIMTERENIDRRLNELEVNSPAGWATNLIERLVIEEFK